MRFSFNFEKDFHCFHVNKIFKLGLYRFIKIYKNKKNNHSIVKVSEKSEDTKWVHLTTEEQHFKNVSFLM